MELNGAIGVEVENSLVLLRHFPKHNHIVCPPTDLDLPNLLSGRTLEYAGGSHEVVKPFLIELVGFEEVYRLERDLRKRKCWDESR